ncbi:MAG: hypothetical protein AABZ53_12720 [Planctomycetota bacterium]
MDFRGIFDHGIIRPTEPISLPQGTEVDCRAVSPANGVKPVDATADGFWARKSIEELAREQQVTPIRSLDDLRGDWPADESIDDFIHSFREDRR